MHFQITSCDTGHKQQEAQLSQRDHATLCRWIFC